MTESDLPIAIAARVPGFLLRLGVGFLRMQRQRKSGVRAFHRTLLENGVPSELANRLAESYHRAGSPRNLIGSFGPHVGNRGGPGP
ncbi:MAG TPA: hypothetical protein VJ224_03835 [Thermoplasmata archaeon]|nr:hypothetical protein [Thermoplasmata archaeon]